MPTTELRRRPRAARLPPEERRALLTAAGVRVLARRGIGAARPTDVAVEAGVSEATVYSYFPTREALITAVLDEVARYYLDLNAGVLSQSDRTLAARLRELIARVSASVERDPDYARVWLNWSSAIRADTWPSFLEIEALIVGGVATAVRSAPRSERTTIDVHPEDLGRLLLGACEMIVRMQFAERSPVEVRRFIRSVLDKLLGDSGE